MKERIAKLIDLKSLVTLLLTIAFIYGFIVGKISKENFMTIFAMIITFYFVKKSKGGEIDE